jgi:hypothetical protein
LSCFSETENQVQLVNDLALDLQTKINNDNQFFIGFVLQTSVITQDITQRIINEEMVND